MHNTHFCQVQQLQVSLCSPSTNLKKKVSVILMLGITSLLFLKLKNKTKHFLINESLRNLHQSAHILNYLGNCILIISPLPFFRTNQIHRTVLLEFAELHKIGTPSGCQ